MAVAIDIHTRLDALHRVLAGYGSVVVAFSGGADSALVAAAAQRALGDRALAVTAVSPSLAPGELDEARAVAREIGIAHRTVRTHEIEKPGYLANGADRCYHCKTELYDVLQGLADAEGFLSIASGTNADDLGDYRPGLQAASEHDVRQPLVDAGFTKDDVRAASSTLGLRTASKPASACLASRIPHGTVITVERLSAVGRAEALLKQRGFRQVRVRAHGDVARIEVELDDVERLAQPGVRDQIVDGVRALGFSFVTLDLEGFRSGSLNPPEALR